MEKILKCGKYKLDGWLDSKVNDDTITTKYEKSEYSLPRYFNKSVNISRFDRYYGEDDSDIKASDEFYISLLKNSSVKEINEDTQLEFLDKITEKYRGDNDTEGREILIPPNTNRHHVNYLFKELVDYSNANNFAYNIYNYEKDSDEIMSLIDTDFKEAFYKFCYDNTHKEKCSY